RFAAPLPRRRTNTRRMTTACMRLPPLASGGDGGLPILFVETDQDPLAVGQDRPAQKQRLLFDPIEPFFVAELLVLQAELTVHPAPGADERPRAARQLRGKPLQRFPVGRVVIDMHRDEVHALLRKPRFRSTRRGSVRVVIKRPLSRHACPLPMKDNLALPRTIWEHAEFLGRVPRTSETTGRTITHGRSRKD